MLKHGSRGRCSGAPRARRHGGGGGKPAEATGVLRAIPPVARFNQETGAQPQGGLNCRKDIEVKRLTLGLEPLTLQHGVTRCDAM